MLSLPILHGYCTIQLYWKVGGNNRYPHTIVWKVCGNTLVSEDDFLVLNQERWLSVYSSNTQSYYAYRVEVSSVNGKRKTAHIYMAREVLGLPRNPGRYSSKVTDHRNHDTLDNTRDNLRTATRSQNSANVRNSKGRSRFKGIMFNEFGEGITPYIGYNGYTINYSTVHSDVEAGLMYNYGAIILFDKFAYLNVIPEDEMPSRESRWELMGVVVEKLRLIGYI